MVRIVSFTDGFTSSSAPTVSGSQEDYLILNNQAAFIAFSPSLSFDGASFSSVFIDFEIERIDVSNTYRQVGSLLLAYNGTTWSIQPGNYIGDDLMNDPITLAKHFSLSVSTLSGVGTVEYKSGSMGSGYSGTFKVVAIRMVL